MTQSEPWQWSRPVLVGDCIENPGNVGALRAVASLFDWDCCNLKGTSRDDSVRAAEIAEVPTASWGQLAGSLGPSRGTIIALENTEDADDLYGFQPPQGGKMAVVVGNERKGIRREILDSAYQTIRIPVASRKINTINVAAAAAVALYYLSRSGRGRLRTRANPHRSRPALLIAGPTDPIELGSVIRSAAAFGWECLRVQDSHGVWFGTDRVTRSLGRGAARRGRNGIHVLSADGRSAGRFEEVCVVTTGGDGEPIERVDLARGAEQLIVLPDPSGASGAVDSERELGRLARRVRRVRLGLPLADAGFPFRLGASIALAEIARQVGVQKRPQRGPRAPAEARIPFAFDNDETGNL